MLNYSQHLHAFRGRTTKGALLLAVGLPVSAQVVDPADRWMNQGATAMRRGNIPEAEQDFQRAVTAFPQDADAYLGLGMGQLRGGKFDTAVQSLTRASELKPTIPSAHMFRGIALFQMNSIDAAADQLKEEIKLQPNDTEALTWLGIIEIQAGRPEDACGPLAQGAKLNPGDQNVLVFQVRAHTLSAQRAFRSLYKINPDSWYVHRAQAEIDSEAHQPDKAIEEYKGAIKGRRGG